MSTNRTLEDIQGIPWTSLATTRETFRQTRQATYDNFTTLQHPPNVLDEISGMTLNHQHRFYVQRAQSLMFKPTVVHFQLRHVVAAPRPHSLIYVTEDVIRSYCPMQKNENGMHRAVCHTETLRPTALAADRDLVVAGGLGGDYLVHSSASEETVHGQLSPSGVHGSCNHILMQSSRSGASTAHVSHNDSAIRTLDLTENVVVDTFTYDWAVNCTALSPCRRQYLIAGDSTSCYLADASTGKIQTELTGHLDYAFAATWSKCGQFVVTGNQDKTARVFDIRHPKQPLMTIKMNMSGVRSLTFTQDELLVIMEAADFVHIVDTARFRSPFIHCQTIDVFGEMGGIAVNDDRLFMAVADERYGGLFAYQRSWKHLNRFYSTRGL